MIVDRIAIASFRGEYAFLSNFWPMALQHGGIIYPTAEHLFVALKTTGTDVRRQIAALKTPGEAKRIGRTLILRPGWDELKTELMGYILTLKFAPGSDLARRLVATGERPLIEGNRWHDSFWGNCECGRCTPGHNWLGRLLMARRKELQG